MALEAVRVLPLNCTEHTIFVLQVRGSFCPGTIAAAFQSWAYGGFTPAGGFFATLTSMGMLGILAPIEASAAAVTATLVTVIVWICGVGR